MKNQTEAFRKAYSILFDEIEKTYGKGKVKSVKFIINDAPNNVNISDDVSSPNISDRICFVDPFTRKMVCR